MPQNPWEHTNPDGPEPCAMCGEDAVVGVLVQGHSREVPLCDTCADTAVTNCAGCENTFWTRYGTRIYGTSSLYCPRCAKQINDAIAAKKPISRIDEARR